MEISEWKDIAEAVNAVVTALAITIAGFWAYLKFIKNRLKFPRADLSHEIYFKSLIPHKALVHITVIVSNTGGVLLPITHVWTRLHQILPLSEDICRALEENQEVEYDEEGTEITWPELGCRQVVHEKGAAEIEPGEFQRFEFDFIIDARIETIAAYSFFKNSAKAGPGWCRTTIVDIQKGVDHVETPTAPEITSAISTRSKAHPSTSQKPSVPT